MALHHVFDTPDDKLVWDVGHQCYPPKILTGRRKHIRTLRQPAGSPASPSAPKASMTRSARPTPPPRSPPRQARAAARDIKGEQRNVIAVIGDGSLSGGMAYEALNNAGASNSRLIVILNDNEMSISEPVGAVSAYLSRIFSSQTYMSMRDVGKRLTRKFGPTIDQAVTRAVEHTRGYITNGTLFEELGFYHLGPVDGHNLDHLVPILRNVKDFADGPVLIHVITQKGKGYKPAETAPDNYHGVARFDIATGQQVKPAANAPSYTKVFANSLIKEARKDERIVGVTAAMPSGTGLDLFAKEFPSRCFDVGIAEQHAVTFAAGMAADGIKPFVAIYSTFLQRGYDQIVHDVALQKLPVRFALDRAGHVGADGPTHCGAFDIAYLACIPNMVVMAPSDEGELVDMVATAAAFDEGPIAFRFPRADGIGVDLPDEGRILEIGKGRMIREGGHIAILSYGTRLQEALRAADELESRGFSTSVADARFAKPLDLALLRQLARNHQALITVEEGSSGGFGAHVLQALAAMGLLDGGLKVRTLTLPDLFQDHGAVDALYREAGLDADGIVASVLSIPASLR